MARRRLLLALLTTVAALSCGSRESAPPAATGADVAALPATDVAGTAAQTGTVETLDPTESRRFIGRSNASFDDSPGERIDLTIEGDTLRFPTSCNTVRVPYAVIDGVLLLDHSQWITTAAGCSPDADAAAPRFGELLDSAPTFSIVGDVLSIRSAAGEVELLDASASEATGVTTDVSVGPAGPDGEFDLTMTVFNGLSVTIGTMASLEVTPKSSPTWDDALIYSTRNPGRSGGPCIPDLSNCSIAAMALQIPSNDSVMLSTTSPALEPGVEYLVRLLGIWYTDTNGEYTVATVDPDSFIAPG